MKEGKRVVSKEEEKKKKEVSKERSDNEERNKNIWWRTFKKINISDDESNNIICLFLAVMKRMTV